MIERIFIPLFILIVLVGCIFAQPAPKNSKPQMEQHFTLVIHGGAGTILRKNMSPEKEKAYQEKLQEALQAGYLILSKGGTSVDAVEAAIHVMEDSPLFNAGKGSVYTNEGKVEMDASIMNGKTLNAGAVAGVTNVKHPISAARKVMEESKHVMLSGDGAEEFAKKQGLEIVAPDYFKTERRNLQWKKIKETEAIQLDHDEEGGEYIPPSEIEFNPDSKFGTVGAAAIDVHGNMAAATSTGGMMNKRFGRIGDSPIIAAGTYANNNTCAISSTGEGEFFIRAVVAYDISALMEYKGLSLQQAADTVIHKKLPALGGKGGIIGVDSKGNPVMVFNTAGMYRGWINESGVPTVGIYKE